MANSSNQPPHPLIGCVLKERYRIVSRLGGGGFGETFLAKDIHMAEEEFCVVKKLRPPSLDEAIIEKCRELFKKEALVLQKLGKHPQIPELKAYFLDQMDFYLVQEYIKGHSLDNELGVTREDDIIALLENILVVLVEVHKNGVIHRDIKPDNLMRRQSDNQIFLIDFGAVKQVTTQIANSGAQLNNATLIGTPGHMAPEQANGNPTFASDIYSLGIVIISKLIGGIPSNSDSEGNLIWLGDLPPDVQISNKLVQILNRMTRLALNERYQSAQDVLNDVQSLSSPKSVKRNPSSNAYNSSNASNSSPTQIINPSFSIPKILIISLLASCVVGIGVVLVRNLMISPPSLNSNWTPYQDNDHNFVVSYPERWQLTQLDTISGEVEIAPPDPQSEYKVFISIESLKNKPNISLAEYTQALAKHISTGVTSSPLSFYDRELANQEGGEIVYNTKENGQEVQVRVNFTLADEKAYLITTIKGDLNDTKTQEITNKILDSFELTQSSP